MSRHTRYRTHHVLLGNIPTASLNAAGVTAILLIDILLAIVLVASYSCPPLPYTLLVSHRIPTRCRCPTGSLHAVGVLPRRYMPPASHCHPPHRHLTRYCTRRVLLVLTASLHAAGVPPPSSSSTSYSLSYSSPATCPPLSSSMSYSLRLSRNSIRHVVFLRLPAVPVNLRAALTTSQGREHTATHSPSYSPLYSSRLTRYRTHRVLLGNIPTASLHAAGVPPPSSSSTSYLPLYSSRPTRTHRVLHGDILIASLHAAPPIATSSSICR